MMTDPIADMLTRIRNALRIKSKSVVIPHSKLKQALGECLLREGYLAGLQTIEQDDRKNIVAELKYGPNGEHVIRTLKRRSRPGCREYHAHNDLEEVMNGLGIGIYTTNQGVLSDREMRSRRVGGEYLCTVS